MIVLLAFVRISFRKSSENHKNEYWWPTTQPIQCYQILLFTEHKMSCSIKILEIGIQGMRHCFSEAAKYNMHFHNSL